MVRSAAALAVALILPGSAAAQEMPQGNPQEATQGTHTVVDHDTLWDLAEHYLTDPWSWPRIWEANRNRVDDPDFILPGWVLVIPGLEGEGTVTQIEIGPTPMPNPQREDLATMRTVFFPDTGGFRESVLALAELEYSAVSRDGVYSAPWLIPLFAEPEHLGVLEGLAGEVGRRMPMLHTYQRVRVSLSGGTVRVGDLLQTYRVSRTIEDVGQVVSPSGVITVSELDAQGAVGIITKEYARVRQGDYVRPVPSYTLQPGQQPEPISGGSESVILGFETRSALHDLGSVAFLDVGSDDGIAIGDVFELFDRSAGTGVTTGALRVVGVTPGGSAANILDMDGAVFGPGVVVQLTRKMR